MTLLEFRNFIYTHVLMTSTQGSLGNTNLSPARTGDDELNDLIHFEHIRLFTQIVASGDRYFHKSGLVSETLGGKVYDLPLDCYRTLRIERVAGGSGIAVPYTMTAIGGTPVEIDAYRYQPAASQSDPASEAYYQHGQKHFELANASPSAVANAFKVYYISRPARMTADGHVPFQSPAATAPGTAYDNLEEWHDLIAWGALENVAMKVGDLDASRISAKVAQRYAELRMFLGRPAKQRPRMMNYTGG